MLLRMASIDTYETKGGTRYAVRWRDPDGTTHSQTEDSLARAEAVKQEAERRVRQMRADARREGIALPELNKTYREVGDDWLSTIPKEGTREGHRIRLEKHVYPVLGGKTFRSIDATEVVKTIRSWTSLAPSTRVVTFTSLKGVFTWAEGKRIITKETNPCKSDVVKKAKPRIPASDPPDAWPREWIRNVKRDIRKDCRPAAWLAAHLGLRQGECLGASPDDFIVKKDGKRYFQVRRQVLCRNDNTLEFGPPKHRMEADDPREIPVPDVLWEFLQEHAKECPTMPVTLPWDAGDGSKKEMRTYELFMTTRQGGAWNRNYFNRSVWKPLLASLGIPDNQNGMHALRHWFACNALENRAGLARVGAWLGHRSAAFTLKEYGRFDVQGTEDIVAKMDADAREMMEN